MACTFPTKSLNHNDCNINAIYQTSKKNSDILKISRTFVLHNNKYEVINKLVEKYSFILNVFSLFKKKKRLWKKNPGHTHPKY